MDIKTVEKVEAREEAADGEGAVVVGGDKGVLVSEGGGAIVVGGDAGTLLSEGRGAAARLAVTLMLNF